MTRRKVSPEDELAILEVIEATNLECADLMDRHRAELAALKQRRERALRQIPGYPALAGWKGVHK
jgi:hypothetical protein